MAKEAFEEAARIITGEAQIWRDVDFERALGAVARAMAMVWEETHYPHGCCAAEVQVNREKDKDRVAARLVERLKAESHT
jgi:hypothetical protein